MKLKSTINTIDHLDPFTLKSVLLLYFLQNNINLIDGFIQKYSDIFKFSFRLIYEMIIFISLLEKTV